MLEEAQGHKETEQEKGGEGVGGEVEALVASRAAAVFGADSNPSGYFRATISRPRPAPGQNVRMVKNY